MALLSSSRLDSHALPPWPFWACSSTRHIILLLIFLSISLATPTETLDRRKPLLLSTEAGSRLIDEETASLTNVSVDEVMSELEVNSEHSSPVQLHVQVPENTPLLPRAAANIPRPFDTTVGDNFTTPGCKSWFNSFIKTNQVLACVPVSLLLQTSTSFFHAARSIVTLTSTLDTSCGVDYDACSAALDQYAAQLQLKSNCMQDFTNQNPIVVQAYVGLIAYKPVYRAACLKAKDTDSNGTAPYCMAQAFTNRSAPSNSYPYYLPLGTDLPGGAVPTCSRCLADTMQGYAAYAGNGTQPISAIYRDAVQTVDLNCGPKFVNATVPNVSGSAAVRPFVLGAGLVSFGAMVLVGF